MKNKIKRILGILLSLVIVLGMIPGTNLTAYADQVHCPECGSTDVGRILRTFKIKKNVEVTDNGKIII